MSDETKHGDLIPHETRLTARLFGGGPTVVGNWDKYALTWEITQEGPYKGRQVEQKLGMDDEYLEKALAKLAAIGITEDNILTERPACEVATVMVVIDKPYTSKKTGQEVVGNSVRYFDVPRGSGPIDAGLKARLQKRLAARKGGGAMGVDASPFGGDSGALEDPSGIPF